MFVNIAVAGRTTLAPTELVRACKAVEQQVGRTRTTRWREREIDVDVILVGDAVVNSDGICIPHPRMHERMFVLRPACDVAPAMVHPLLGTTVKSLLDACADTAAVDVFDPTIP
jgi:2-amino-4-hydroxy-6-hydroxymethyldihydropteridine diphosphokinase